MRLQPPANARTFLQQPGRPWLTNAALLLFGLLLIEFCRAGVVEFNHYVFGFSADIFGQLVLYLGAISLIERSPTDKWTLRIVLAVAVLARMVCVFHPAFLSTDVYRYVWDGKVQAAGINPYRYIPDDSHLSFLRDLHIYPNINRRDYAHTIYPPGAQAIFLAVTRLSATESFMKMAMVGFEAVTCVVLMRILRLLGLPRERVVLYAWHPVCIWELASSGHVDAAALTFISLALYAHLRNHSTRAGAWLAAATLVKLYPVVLFPALLTRPFRRNQLRMAAMLVGVIVAGYLCYASVGWGVFGFLPEYAVEEGIDTGSRYFPLKAINGWLHTAIPSNAYLACCAVLGLGLCVWAYRRSARREAVFTSALVIATVLILCYAPHYPWYFLWLLPCLTIYPWRPAFYLVLAPTFLFSTDLAEPGPTMIVLYHLLYGGFFIVLAYDLLARSMARGAVARMFTRKPQATLLAEHTAHARDL